MVFTMNKLILVLVFMFSAVNGFAAEKLNVVTSHRILEDWVQQIGKEHVEVSSLYKGKRNIHFFEPRPSHIKRLSKADALVIGGLDMDPWMPDLIAASRNRKIQYGTDGLIDPSVDILVLEKPTGKLDMSLGDVHAFGNPHFQFYKESVLKAIQNIADGLSRLKPELRQTFQSNAQAYKEKVGSTYDRLTAEFEPYRDTKVVTFHKSWEYFGEQFGLEIIGYLEPKPGIPPSPNHLAQLVKRMKLENASLILAEKYYSKSAVNSLAKGTGAQVVPLANFIGERKEDQTYIDLLENNVKELIGVLSK